MREKQILRHANGRLRAYKQWLDHNMPESGEVLTLYQLERESSQEDIADKFAKLKRDLRVAAGSNKWDSSVDDEQRELDALVQHSEATMRAAAVKRIQATNAKPVPSQTRAEEVAAEREWQSVQKDLEWITSGQADRELAEQERQIRARHEQRRLQEWQKFYQEAEAEAVMTTGEKFVLGFAVVAAVTGAFLWIRSRR
jgi:hypothetical protein